MCMYSVAVRLSGEFLSSPGLAFALLFSSLLLSFTLSFLGSIICAPLLHRMVDPLPPSCSLEREERACVLRVRVCE